MAGHRLPGELNHTRIVRLVFAGGPDGMFHRSHDDAAGFGDGDFGFMLGVQLGVEGQVGKAQLTRGVAESYAIQVAGRQPTLGARGKEGALRDDEFAEEDAEGGRVGADDALSIVSLFALQVTPRRRRRGLTQLKLHVSGCHSFVQIRGDVFGGANFCEAV